MMSKDPDTDIAERVKALEVRVDGGPGETPACKRHEQAVFRLEGKMDAMREAFDMLRMRMKFWGWGLAALLTVLNLASPFVRDVVAKHKVPIVRAP